MRVLVTGGRDFKDKALLWDEMNALHACTPVTVLGHGDARGADQMAGGWAEYHNIAVLRYPANWRNLDEAAGTLRNEYMFLDFRPDLVVAFPGGPGTRHMTKLAEKWATAVMRIG